MSAGWLRPQGRKGPGGLPVQRSKSSWPAGSPTILRLPFCLSWPPGRRACTQLDHRTGWLGAQPLLLLQTSPDPIPTAGGVTVLTDARTAVTSCNRPTHHSTMGCTEIPSEGKGCLEAQVWRSPRKERDFKGLRRSQRPEVKNNNYSYSLGNIY